VPTTTDGVYDSGGKIVFEAVLSDAEDGPDRLSAAWSSDLGLDAIPDDARGHDGAIVGAGWVAECPGG
jgi:hypothetical protein